MSTLPKKRITKKIDSSHIIWFEESNSWIQLEEPAWYIYKNLQYGDTARVISRKFSKKYALGIDETLVFVNDIIIQIGKLCSKSFHPEKALSGKDYKHPLNFFCRHTYKINQKRFEIHFSSRLLEFIIHPSFAHLEIKTPANSHYIIQVFSTEKLHVLKINDRVWTEKDPSFLKRKLFIELTNLIYEKSENNWLAYIHGSAVSNGSESIILTTECGSGKSTLASLLCNEGLQFVSDDYIPIDARFCKAYPFPAALSVKDGAFPVLSPLFVQLKNAEVFHFKGTNKTVRYLPFPDSKNFYKPLPVRNLVFVQYGASKRCSIRKVPTLEAIRRFNDEAWLSPIPAHAKKFIMWFPKLNFYELEYSENEMAVREILGLFGSRLYLSS
jgi:hypothetical protein